MSHTPSFHRPGTVDPYVHRLRIAFFETIDKVLPTEAHSLDEKAGAGFDQLRLSLDRLGTNPTEHSLSVLRLASSLVAPSELPEPDEDLEDFLREVAPEDLGRLVAGSYETEETDRDVVPITKGATR